MAERLRNNPLTPSGVEGRQRVARPLEVATARLSPLDSARGERSGLRSESCWPVLWAGLAILLLGAGCTPTCEQAAAKKNHAAAATRCEQAYLEGRSPAHALATLRALEQLGRSAELKARLPWLIGTAYEAAVSPYYRALAARGSDDAAARRDLQTCLEASQRGGLHDYAARCARQLASLQWTEGSFEAAFHTVAIAMAEVRQAGDPILEGKVYGQLADLLGEVGDVAGEARALSFVAARFKSSSPGGYAQVRLRQGKIELARGGPQIARDCFDEALGLSADAGLTSVVRSAHLNLAAVARAASDWDAGQQHLDAAAALPALRAYEDTALWFAQAQLHASRGQWSQAQATLGRALDAGAVADWHWQLKALEAESHEGLGDPAAARASYEHAAATIESMRQALGSAALRPGLLAARRRPYEALFELHAQQGNVEPALELLEQLLARSFLEAMGTAQPATADLDTSARNALRRVSTLGGLTAWEKAQPAPQIAALLPRLGKREVLAFLVARGHLYRAHVLSGKVTLTQLEPIAALQKKLQHLDAHPEDAQAAEAVGAALWPTHPVGPQVVIVPDPTLSALSFAGLKVGGRFLVEDHVFSYAPGVSLAVEPAAGASSGPVVVLGDPRGNLPGAALEARETARVLDGGLSLGGEATVDRLLGACGARFLHLAAHSGVGPDGPWIELADGAITAAQLLENRCAPAVVYLASCASAASARKDASGTLASAFLAAGSRNVIATTRSIDDATAARFTRELFAAGKLDQLPLRLAAAQRKLLATQPRQAWESFIVLGQ